MQHVDNVTDRIKLWCKRQIGYMLKIINEYDYYHQFKKKNIDLNRYEFIVTTYSIHANHIIGSYIKKEIYNAIL